jgi:hypothetical protein
MIIQVVIPAGGDPVTLPAAQFTVSVASAPLAVGAEYGPEGTQDVSVRGLPDFARTMMVLGVPSTVIVDPHRLAYAGMVIAVVPKIGEHPVTLPARRFVVYQDNGTPIVAGVEFGSNQPSVAMVGMDRFQQILGLCGITTRVDVQTIQMPKPQPGARLVAGPKE